MLAITMGDPAGIGPEVTLKGWAETPRRLHIGDPAVYHQTAARLGMNIPFKNITSPEEAATLPPNLFAILPTQHQTDAAHHPLVWGQPNTLHAAATVESIRTACRLAMQHRVTAIVTPPIHKAVLHAAQFDFPGHTELLAQCTGVDHPVMMLAGKGLRVVPTTLHQSLASVARTLTPNLLRTTLQTTYEALRTSFAIPHPRIVVTGLNPHAGEAGAFGREEQEIIAPLCQTLAAQWHGAVRGPLPADTLFHPEARKTYDAVVCMYHDQALIPLKMLAFGQAVNITLGLPIVRTSVDHGTAYAVAGQGVADPGSFVGAINMAVMLAKHRPHANPPSNTT